MRTLHRSPTILNHVGRGFQLTLDDQGRWGTAVHFWDMGANPADFPEGQMCAGYGLSTIVEVVRRGQGLDLHLAVDAWKVDAGFMRQAVEWLRSVGAI